MAYTVNHYDGQTCQDDPIADNRLPHKNLLPLHQIIPRKYTFPKVFICCDKGGTLRELRNRVTRDSQENFTWTLFTHMNRVRLQDLRWPWGHFNGRLPVGIFYTCGRSSLTNCSQASYIDWTVRLTGGLVGVLDIQQFEGAHCNNNYLDIQRVMEIMADGYELCFLFRIRVWSCAFFPQLSAVNRRVKYGRWFYHGAIRLRLVKHIALFLIFCVGGAFAQDGYWVNTGGGSWAGAGNWDAANGVAGGADSTAYFGFSREASIPPNATFTLDGAQTVGHLCFTTQGGPSSWNFNSGAGGSLILDSTFGQSEITVTSPLLQVTLNVLVAGKAGLEKDGPGILFLAAQNTYAGQTLVNGGGLTVNGSIGAGPVEVDNGSFNGTGVVNGPVVIGSGRHARAGQRGWASDDQ